MTFSPDDDDRLWRSEKPKGWYRFASPFRYALFIILLVGVLAAIWYILSPSRHTFTPKELALIEAETTPYKIKVADEGIPHIKHQDKLIYGRIRSDQKDPVVEHILPDPEEPSLKMVEQYVSQDSKKEIVKVNLPEKPAEIQSIADLIDEPSMDEPSSDSTQKGNLYLQLGSYKTKESAKTKWDLISKNHKDILGISAPIIQRIDLGAGKGTEYRLRTGPFKNKKEAADVHKKLKERKVECIVIK